MNNSMVIRCLLSTYYGLEIVLLQYNMVEIAK